MFIKTAAYSALIDRLHDGSETLALWLDALLPKVLPNLNISKKTFGFYRAVPEAVPYAAHSLRPTVHWMKAAIANRDEWVQPQNLDAKGVPLRIREMTSNSEMSCAVTGDRLENKMRIRAMFNDEAYQNLSVTDLAAEGHIEIVHQFEDGRVFVRLKTPFALDRDSFLMDNCIGYGHNDGNLGRDGYAYYSLWGVTGKPHVDMEVVQGRILQCEGKANLPPVAKYLTYVESFSNLNGWRVANSPVKTGLIQKNDGSVKAVYSPLQPNA